MIKRSATAMSGTPETIRSIRIEKRFLSLKEKKKEVAQRGMTASVNPVLEERRTAFIFQEGQ